jgi:hypothetical protein
VSQLKKISLRRSYDQRRAQITQDLQLFGGGSDKIVDLEQRGLRAGFENLDGRLSGFSA